MEVGRATRPLKSEKVAGKLPVVSAGGETNTPTSKQRVDAGEETYCLRMENWSDWRVLSVLPT